tara:strand:- start:30 stop:227 length:198 start_codon:yes stop_codon:yes gene_type:complete
MEEENKNINAFAELMSLEENEKGLDFSTMEDGKKTIITNEEPVDNKNQMKKFINYLYQQFQKGGA